MSFCFINTGFNFLFKWGVTQDNCEQLSNKILVGKRWLGVLFCYTHLHFTTLHYNETLDDLWKLVAEVNLEFSSLLSFKQSAAWCLFLQIKQEISDLHSFATWDRFIEIKQSFFLFIKALRACNSVTTRQFSVLCYLSQNQDFMKDVLVIKDAALIGFSLLAISFS